MKTLSTILVFAFVAACGLEASGQAYNSGSGNSSAAGLFGARSLGSPVSAGTRTFSGNSMGGMGGMEMGGMGISGMSNMGIGGTTGFTGLSGMSSYGGSTQSGQFIVQIPARLRLLAAANSDKISRPDRILDRTTAKTLATLADRSITVRISRVIPITVRADTPRAIAIRSS